MLTVIMVLCATFLDFLLGEPRHYHPLAGFARLVNWLEKRFYPPEGRSPRHFMFAGVLCWLILVLPFVALSWWLMTLPFVATLVPIAGLYLALGGQSLAEHAQTVQAALEAGNLRYARERVAMMVKYDSRELDEPGVCRATIESVLVNGNGAVFAVIFWFVLLGLPGVVLYRLTNTLNTIWGCMDVRYVYFGRAAARIDDVLNWVPARLTALTYVLVGGAWHHFMTWLAQARQWKGRSVGWLMACGAGGMALKLGGPALYHGHEEHRPWLGNGDAPTTGDIGRSIRFIQQGLWLWLGLLFLGSWLSI